MSAKPPDGGFEADADGRHADPALAADAAARRAAQSEFEHPVVLEAGAGTGKTTTLVARTVIWCLGPGWDEAAEAAAAPDPPAPTSAAEPAPEAAERGRARIAAAVLEGVVGITFTEAAAAEMANRVAAALAAISRAAGDELPGLELDLLPGHLDDGERRSRARALLGALDHLGVRTIHAYCRTLLTAHPIAAGLHPELAVDADGSVVEEVVRVEVESAARAAYAGDPGHPLLRLAGHGVGPRRIALAAAELVEEGFSAERLARSPLDAAGSAAMMARLGERLDAFARAGGERLDQVVRGSKARKVCVALTASRQRLAGLDPAHSSAAAAVRALLDELWTVAELRALGAWQKGKFSQSEAALLGDDLERFATAAGELRSLLRHLRRLDPELLESARRCLLPILVEVERTLRSRGVLTFSALLGEARDLLANDPRVRAREQRRIRQLLVDEFQDTDRLQCEIVRRLTLDAPPERRGGLFIVGDPKQSIYGWRDADLAAYEEFVTAAVAAGGARHQLVRNFRSAAPILAEVNRAIEPVMREEAGLQPRYEPLVPSGARRHDPGFAEDDRSAVEHWVSWPGETALGETATAVEAAELEAAAIAADAERLHREQGVSYSELGLLLRSTSHQETYLEAFRRRGVPFLVSRDKSYYRRREIIDAAALVRAVVNPADHLALVAWLRSPTVGVPDAAWIPLWRHGLPALLTTLDRPTPKRLREIEACVAAAAAELPPGIPGLERLGDWPLSLVDAVRALARARKEYRELPADRFLERLRADVLIEPGAAARFLGEFRLANLDRFFRRLEEAMEQRGGDVQAVLRAIRRGVSESREAEEALPKETAEEAVRVLTIHAAKGLEFEHLYLPQTHAQSGGGEDSEVDIDERWRPGESPEYSLFGSPTPGFDRVEERRRRVEAAERVRLLYVALTRARRRLVILGRWPRQASATDAAAATTHLELLGHRAPGDLGELQEKARDAGGSAIDRHGARWRFPGLVATAPGEPTGAAGAAPHTTATAAQVEGASRRLARRRTSARRRARRSLVRAASSSTGERLSRALEEAPAEAAASREVALVVGEGVHRMLEAWVAATPRAEQLARHREGLLAELPRRLPAARLAAARERLDALFERLGRGTLLDRLTELEPRVLGREVPLILPATAGRALAEPLAAWSGAIDLIFRDADGATVLVDFKTDRVEGTEAVARRAAGYTEQAAVYREAARQALALDEAPRFELWFLWPDLVWTGAAADSQST